MYDLFADYLNAAVSLPKRTTFSSETTLTEENRLVLRPLILSKTGQSINQQVLR